MESNRAPVVLAEPAWIFVLMWGGFPLIGAFAGWAFTWLADWVASLSWAPLQGVFELVAAIPEPYGTLVPVAVGALLGLGVAFLGHFDALKLTFESGRITLQRGDQSRQIDAVEVKSAFKDGSYLVLLTAAGAELAREKTDMSADSIRDTFVAQGISWHDEDPYRQQWRRWVDGTPDLPAGANDLLRTRAEEVKKDTPDLEDIRAELARLNVMVRDANKKQYWRISAD